MPGGADGGASFGAELLKLMLSAAAGAVSGHIAARRSKRDAAVDNLLQTLNEVAEVAEDYWSVAGTNENSARLARRLKAKLRDVGRRNTTLERSFATYQFQDRSKIIELRQAATGDDFDAANRAPNLDRVELVHDAAAELRDEIEKARCYVWQVPVRRWPAAVAQLFQR